MALLASLAGLAVAVALLIVYIMIVIQMFKHGEQVMGIVSIITLFCCFGTIIVLVYGWIKAAPWNMQQLMAVYTGLFIVYLLLTGVNFSMGAFNMQIPN